MSSKSKISSDKAPKKTSANKPAPSRASANNNEGAARVFKDQAAWLAWLETNHSRSTGIWLGLAKKNSDLKSVSYAEALETALCYGWIDGQKRPENDLTWSQRFCPRSAKSIWSKINRERALSLIKSGRMRPAGHQAIEQAKSNG
ncbi:MAG: YdeI/OmpD-associated family protein [Terriglobales bacterium]